MSQFEYLAVLVSLILGLGITRLLAGLGRMMHRREHSRMDTVHLLWTAAVFWTLILNWWVFFESSEIEVWTFDDFVVVVIWAVIFYLLAAFLYPPDLSDDEGYGEVFERNRKWFLGLFIASSFADIALTGSRGDLLDPPFYLPFVGHFIGLGLLALLVDARRVQIVVAGYVLTMGVMWSLVARRFLGG